MNLSTAPKILQVFANWRMAVVLLTGFSSGLPYALTGAALQAWLKRAGVNIEAIGFFAIVTLPYSLKFLWSPLMDRFVPPMLGRRRGWMLVSQVALIAGIIAMSLTGAANAWMLGLVAVLVAFFSASQDIVVDAYRTDCLRPDELGAGAGLFILGYRLGWISSGAISLMLAGFMSWESVYLVMAAGMLVGLVTTLLAPEPAVGVRAPQTLAQAVVLPFREFLLRRGAVEMLLFILVYKLDWAMVSRMTSAFVLDIGFTEVELGAASGLGIFTGIAGAAIGGVVISAIGIRRSLWIFGLLQGLAGMSFTALAFVGKNHVMMLTAVMVENWCSGMATAAFVGFLMSLCNKRFTATQYALLTSLMTLGGTLVVTPAGWLIKIVGWSGYFILATAIAVPGLLLLLRFKKWQGPPTTG